MSFLQNPGVCTALQQDNPSVYFKNTVSTGLTTGITFMISVVYLVNTVFVIRSIATTSDHVRLPKSDRAELDIGKLPGLSAAIFALAIIPATWHQPIEAAAILINVVAQASALVLQNSDPERLGKNLIERLWDILAVVIVASAYILSDVRGKWLEAQPDPILERGRDPQRQVTLAYVFAGLTALVAFPQEFLVCLAHSIESKKTIMRYCSIMFLLVQLSVVAGSMYYGQSTITNECIVFNLAKFSALATLSIGILYSIVLCIMRYNLILGSWKEGDSPAEEKEKVAEAGSEGAAEADNEPKAAA